MYGMRAAVTSLTLGLLLAAGCGPASDQPELAEATGAYTHHYPVCIRKVLPDDTLISPASEGPEAWYAVSLISYAPPSERKGFEAFAKIFAESFARLFGGRPHWGKHCPLTFPEIDQLYPRLSEFREICDRADPEGRFRNEFVCSRLGLKPGDIAERKT